MIPRSHEHYRCKNCERWVHFPATANLIECWLCGDLSSSSDREPTTIPASSRSHTNAPLTTESANAPSATESAVTSAETKSATTIIRAPSLPIASATNANET